MLFAQGKTPPNGDTAARKELDDSRGDKEKWRGRYSASHSCPQDEDSTGDALEDPELMAVGPAQPKTLRGSQLPAETSQEEPGTPSP
ncbi:UNVERIFIED_CONTAM: hypothetical protein K2H54_058533 [Gekko kuhli]